MISILLADDHQIVLDGLKQHFDANPDFEVLTTCTDGKECYDRAIALQPDVVIADIDMPLMNGIELTRKLKSEGHKSRIIILTFHNEQSIIKKLVEYKVDGYLLKNSEMNELDLAVNKVHAGQPYFSSDVTLSLLQSQELKRNISAPDISKKLSELTEREIEVLKGIADGLSNKKIGDKLFISHKTVDSHRSNLMKKLEANNMAKLIKFAIKAGLVD